MNSKYVFLALLFENQKGIWGDDVSAVKNMCYSCRGPVFSSQHPHDDLKLSITPVTVEMKPSSGLGGHHTHTCVHI